MTMSRRTFIVVTGLVPASPLLASLPIRSTYAESPSRLDRQRHLVHGSDANDLVLKIEGWEEAGANAPVEGELWITIGPSWRSAWR